MLSDQPSVTGFRKLSKSAQSDPSLKGTRPSLHSSLQQTSTGIQSLDLLLGNGINLSSSLLVQEEDRGQYTPLFAKHFLSEGITHGHTVVCAGERVSTWLSSLPKPIEQDVSETEPQSEDSLKIAWRYKRKIQSRYSHSYDLSQHRSPEDIAQCHVIPTCSSHSDLIKYLEQIVGDHDSTVVRIVLDRPVFPVADESEFIRFHYHLRRVTAGKNVVMLCVYPIKVMSEYLSFHLPQLFNNVINVQSLPRDKNSVFKDYHGRLRLIKIDNVCSFTMPLYDVTDRFFKVLRKKFIIEKMYLPPDLSETVSRSSSASTGGCSSSKGIDF